jgi:hypothetical protein
MPLIHRENITTGLIKVLWVSENGPTMWDNSAELSTLRELTITQSTPAIS